ncbi:MAG: hypothetical protein NTZ75_08240 [Euryarchaeota archaeon]|nr:hypothetical protein [Euryarchaeota archaeon]
MTEIELEKVEQKMNMKDLANLLHSALFSLERAIQETNSRTSMVITSHSCKFLDKIEEKKGSKLFSSKSIEEAIKNFVEFTSGSDFFEHVEFKKIGDEEYLFKIDGCMLAKSGVHDTLDPKNDICPIALVAGAILKHDNPSSDVIVEPSKFTDTGIENIIHFVMYK